MKKWMWSEQQRPLRLPLLQFLIQSAQVISFSSYSISNHFSPNLLYSTLLWMQTNRTWKSHRLWNTPHCRSSLIDSTPPCPGPAPTPTFSLLYYITLHTYFRNLIQFFFLKLHSLWICNCDLIMQFSWTETSIVSQHYLFTVLLPLLFVLSFQLLHYIMIAYIVEDFVQFFLKLHCI